MPAIRVFTLLLVLMIAGCGGPHALVGMHNSRIAASDVPGTSQHRLFVATTRAPSDVPGEFYSGERSQTVSFASVDVSIPPNHVSGKIERPGKIPPDPRTDFVILDPVRLQDERGFVAGIDAALAARPPEDREILLFVHGYNTNMSSAILRLGQFVEDTGFRGVPVLFSWASSGQTLKYVYDMNSAIQARDALEHTALLLNRTKADSASVVAHSMGNLLTVETMRQMEIKGRFRKSGKLRNVILASPDIDIDVFASQVASIPPEDRRFFVLIARDDKALRLSRRIAGGVNRVGAADADTLADLGVIVIDLTQIDDSNSTHHTKFAESPEVVQLIGEGLSSNGELSTHSPRIVGGLLDALPIKITVGPGLAGEGVR